MHYYLCFLDEAWRAEFRREDGMGRAAKVEPPPWSLALDAHYCIMVRVLPTHRIQVRECDNSPIAGFPSESTHARFELSRSAFSSRDRVHTDNSPRRSSWGHRGRSPYALEWPFAGGPMNFRFRPNLVVPRPDSDSPKMVYRGGCGSVSNDERASPSGTMIGSRSA